MFHAKEYEIVTTQEGALVFAIKSCGNEPDMPILIYDGGNHATFYRTSDDVMLLDYISSEVQNQLKKSKFILVAEIDYKKDVVIRDYKVRVKVFKENPFTDGLK
ncbi:MAG: hypothetical protein PHE89_04960 [Alphaproteobacteria bacterium]|nr:hypothetical protein [Alphaproteobacteria bacterium]